MASWLKKISARSKDKKDPATQIKRLKQVCYNSTQRAIARVDSASDEIVQCVGGIATVFGIWILVGFFNVQYKDIEEINERINSKAEAIAKKWITADDLINYEIRPSHWRNNSIGWAEYEPATFDVEMINKRVWKSKTAQDIETNAAYCQGKYHAFKAFQLAEIFFITAIHDVLGWFQPKCEMFTLLFRALWDCTPKDVYDIHRLLYSRPGYNDGGQLDFLRKCQPLWQLGFARA